MIRRHGPVVILDTGKLQRELHRATRRQRRRAWWDRNDIEVYVVLVVITCIVGALCVVAVSGA